MEALILYLSTRPDIEVIYFDEKGNWVFNKCNLFPIEKSREEILGAEKADPAIDALNKLKKKK